MRAGLAVALLLDVVLVDALPPAPTPQPGPQHIAGVAADFVATYMRGSRVLTVVGQAPWLPALLRRMAATMDTMPAVRLLGGVADGEDGLYDRADEQRGPPQFSGWTAAHVLVVLYSRDHERDLMLAFKRLSPPAQSDPVLVVMLAEPKARLSPEALTSILDTAVQGGGHWHVVILEEPGDVMGFRPLVEGCSALRPQRLAAWRPGGGFAPAGPLFTDLKRLTLNGCPLRAAVFLAPPTALAEDVDGVLKVVGFTGTVMDAMAQVLNTSFRLHREPSSAARYRGVMLPSELGTTVAGKTDVTLGPITGKADRNEVLEWSNLQLTECYAWFVPYSIGTAEPGALVGLVTSFDWRMWALLAAVVAATGACTVLVAGPGRRLALSQAVCSAASVLLAQPPVHRLPAAFSAARVLFGAWMLTALVTSGAYQAKLRSIMSKSDRKGMLTLEELVETGLPAEVPDFIYSDLLYTAESNATLRALMAHASNSIHFESLLRKGFRRSHRAILLEEKLGVYLASTQHRPEDHEPPTYRLPGCFTSYPVNFFAVKRGSPLLARLDEVWKRLYESGILGFLLRDSQRLVAAILTPPRVKPDRRLAAHDLRGCFEMLVVGLALAAVAFLGEHVAANFVPLRLAARRLAELGHGQCRQHRDPPPPTPPRSPESSPSPFTRQWGAAQQKELRQ